MTTKTLKPAVFLDRDGTITVEGGYINHEDRLTLLPRTSAAIQLFNQVGIPVVVVTNQAGVARGYFKEEMVNVVHGRMKELLAAQNAYVDAVYYCPHHPSVGEGEYQQRCNCRKPATGMIDQACAEHGLDPNCSYMVGDKASDIDFAKRTGAKGVLVKTGYGRGELQYQPENFTVEPDFIGNDLFDAALYILKDLDLLSKLED
jgi:D-glycero-D-manno-heptose 1,7-bisphosphate phosphatase